MMDIVKDDFSHDYDMIIIMIAVITMITMIMMMIYADYDN